MSDATQEPMVSADGRPLKQSLARALRRQKIRALLLIAPLLLFVVITYIIPILSMLFRSVENQIVSNTLPHTVVALADWDSTSGNAPDETIFRHLYFDMFKAVESKEHTKLGSRLNYEQSGLSSLFRTTGRRLDDVGKSFQKPLEKIHPNFKAASFWFELLSGKDTNLLNNRRALWSRLTGESMSGDIGFTPSTQMAQMLPWSTRAYTDFAIWTAIDGEKVVAEEAPWEAVYAALAQDLQFAETRTSIANYSGFGADELQTAVANMDQLPAVNFRNEFSQIKKEWTSPKTWSVIQVFSANYTPGYFLNAVDLELTPDGVATKPENTQIYLQLFQRTLVMALIIMSSCILLGYPVAWLLANLPMRAANTLMILVLLPFWTSLLVRTSAWKVLLQQQGVINDILVWLGFVSDANRLVLMNNATGTVIAMTHILLPFMILPLYSVMKTIQPTYLRAAKSLGATNWTAFWRVYFPQSVPGIGAGSILVFILAIGYYITPEIVGGTSGIFISNRIAYHISSSLNWGLAAALGTILLVVVLVLYWAYDKIVGIDNVKLGG